MQNVYREPPLSLPSVHSKVGNGGLTVSSLYVQIQVAAPMDKCKEWNEERDKNKYSVET